MVRTFVVDLKQNMLVLSPKDQVFEELLSIAQGLGKGKMGVRVSDDWHHVEVKAVVEPQVSISDVVIP